jgi:hypothetical protein
MMQMANDEFSLYDIDKTKFPSCRYRKLKRYIDDKGNEMTELYESPEIEVLKNDSYHVVTSGEENKLDLIAYNYYNNEDLWWVIAEANDITDPFNVPASTVLRIPSLTSLYGFGGVLS